MFMFALFMLCLGMLFLRLQFFFGMRVSVIEGVRLASTASQSSRGAVSDAALATLERVCNRVTTNRDILNRHGDDESFNKVVPSLYFVIMMSMPPLPGHTT
jgi:hypothetical protein